MASSSSSSSSSSFQLSQAKTAHVNLMTDTIIANLPADALRCVLRAMLTISPDHSAVFETEAKKYLQRTPFVVPLPIFGVPPESLISRNFYKVQARIRSTLGAGLASDSLQLLCQVVHAANELVFPHDNEEALLALASIDGDVVQAITAVQKTRTTPTGTRSLAKKELEVLHKLLDAISLAKQSWRFKKQEFVLERSFVLISKLLDPGALTLAAPRVCVPAITQATSTTPKFSIKPHIETFSMGGRVLPRLFSGLWQLSSPAWGAAPQSKIMAQFEEYVNMGFTAYDMADHYGDAEVIYGCFRQSYSVPESLYAATKFCVFGPIEVTPEVIVANVTERLTRLQSEHIDLLQFHWQDYSSPGCIAAMKLLAEDSRVKALGLCNFDTPNMAAILAAGVPIVSNQVQFSLIDSRPTFAMAEVCTRQKVKLLTYGTLCGGFLADKWLGRPEPELFDPGLTPSQRKYFEMIGIWGGWTLFQELLGVLDGIAKKHKVSISNVATRWVLDFDYVGAVLVGTRMGVSGHAEENLKAYGWRLDGEDQKAIEAVQVKSRRAVVFQAMGDCGSEYR